MLDHALSHASYGFRVFPIMPAKPDGTCPCSNPACTSPGKHPQIKGWTTEATTDEAKIREWWTRWPNHNIGIATGKESNLLVLDADGAMGLLAIEERGLPETPPSVRTGRIDGGTHFYFQCPIDIDARNFAGRVPGLDARGNGGYVVAAGSRHKTGSTYEWINHIDDYDTPPIPRWLHELLVGGRVREGENVLVGGRNDLLFAQARRLRAVDGKTPTELLEIMLAYNLEHCKPPLDESEVRQIVDNACKEEYAAGPDLVAELRDKEFGTIDIVSAELRSLPRTEVGNGETFIKLMGHAFRYVPQTKEWVVWDGSRWREDRSFAARRGMMLTIRSRAAAASFIPDQDERRAFFAWCRSQETSGKIDGALKAAAAMNSIVALLESFDTHPMLLGMPGATHDFSTATTREPRREDRLTWSVAPKYEPEAKCPIWLKTLHDVFDGDQEMVDYFQRAIGYSSTGSNEEQCMFICHGNGANGKSVTLGTIRDIMGDYGASARYETFNADMGSTRGEDLAALRGRRFILIVEPDQSTKLSEGRVKQVTGGTDQITCRHLYGKDFSYTPEFKLWWAVNHLPRIQGTDDGIWRRIHRIPFTVQFKEASRDSQLSKKLAAEAPGIMNWILEGARLWREQGLRPPKSVLEATAEYREDSDMVGRWLDECTVGVKPNQSVPLQELYMNYANWCGDQGLKALSQSWLGRALKERGYKADKHKATKRPIYYGLTVRESSYAE